MNIEKIEENFKYKDYLNVDWNSKDFYYKNRNLTEQIIEHFKDKINWHYLFNFCRLQENLIEKYFKQEQKDTICFYQTLSQNFIEKHKDILNWDFICSFQSLSQNFIDKYKDKVNWELICKRNFSINFFIKHLNYIKLYIIMDNHFLSDQDKELLFKISFPNK